MSDCVFDGGGGGCWLSSSCFKKKEWTPHGSRRNYVSFSVLISPFLVLGDLCFQKKKRFFVYYSPLTSYWSFERHWNKMTNKTIICHLIINWRWRDADVQLRPTEYCVVKVSRSDPPWFHRSAFGATLRSLKFLWVTERCSSPEAWKGICCVGFILSFISPLLSLH